MILSDKKRDLLYQFFTPEVKRNITYFPELKCIFIGIHKSANSSVNGALLKTIGRQINEHDYRSIHKSKREYLISVARMRQLCEDRDIFVFSVIRNPFTRLYSAYTDKIVRKPHHVIPTGYPNFLYRPHMNFSDFVKSTCSLPDFLLERHLVSQMFHLEAFPGCFKRINYLGKVEDMENVNRILSKKINLGPIEIKNSSGSLRKARKIYTSKLEKMVAKRYKNDFLFLEYYPSLNEIN